MMKKGILTEEFTHRYGLDLKNRLYLKLYL